MRKSDRHLSDFHVKRAACFFQSNDTGLIDTACDIDLYFPCTTKRLTSACYVLGTIEEEYIKCYENYRGGRIYILPRICF